MTVYEPLGFIPVEEVANVFTEALTKLEELGAHRDVITYVESLKHELNKRARRNLEEVLTRMPAEKKTSAEEAARIAAEYEQNKETWRQRTRLGRQFVQGG